MLIRQIAEQNEHLLLASSAAFSDESAGRAIKEDFCPIRTEYARDRDRILHSNSFRRLKQKTQVFLSPRGDHYRTRLTHTLEVSQIARTMARAMRLNEDLAEAISLGHDLGHTPFGHAGERALAKITSLGFTHYDQSVRVVTKLEKDGRGLNLTYETIDGIQCHTNMKACTFEGQLVRIADVMAYLNHDLEDAMYAGVIEGLPSEISDILGETKSQRITTMITSVINNNGEIGYGAEIAGAVKQFSEFMFSNLYLNSKAKVEEPKVESIIESLFEYYLKNTDKMDMLYRRIAAEEGGERAVTDFVSGMSDAYAVAMFETLFIPKSWALDLQSLG